MMMSGAATPPHSMSSGSAPTTPTNGSLGPNSLLGSQAPTQPTIASAFPDPPKQYFSIYTDENVARGTCPDPPKPIVEGNYSMFGMPMTCDDSIIRPLELQGIRRLYPRDYDHKKELRKMNSSILVNFLDMLDVLVKCPDTPKRDDKCGDINMLFIQMHHLINELRPHQARETIRVTMQIQKRERQHITVRLNKQIEKVGDLIANYINGLPEFHETQQGLQDLIATSEPMEEDEELDDMSDDICKMIELDTIMCKLVDESNIT